MGDVRDFLDGHLDGKASPFLFIGSGLSRRYTNCEDWEGLLRVFAEQTDRPYEYYRSSAHGDLPTVASKIAETFHDIWWSDSKYQASRDRWGESLANTQSAFKVEVAAHVAKAVDRMPTDGPLAGELDLLRRAVVDGIITTNFDPVLEELFPDLRTFVGQDQMLFSNPQSVGEIYKIHGSCEEPDSLIITAEDYRRFEQRNAYLAAKLLTTFVEHPVIFLGYSLGDRNVRSVLQSIAACLTQDNIEELRDRLIFVQWEQGSTPGVAPHSILIDDFMLNVIRVQVPDFVEVYESLANLRRAFPARLLRRLKEHVYELVLHDDPKKRLFVADIDDTDAADVDVVFGVGVKAQLGHTGYVGLERWDLIDDVVDNGDAWDPMAIVTEALPHILRGPGNVPVFKYLNRAGLLTKAGAIRKSANVDRRIVNMADTHRGGSPAGQQYVRSAPTRLANVSGVLDLEQKCGPAEVLNYGTCLPPAKVDIAELRSFLQRRRHLRSGQWEGTQYAKLACYLDWLEFGRG